MLRYYKGVLLGTLLVFLALRGMSGNNARPGKPAASKAKAPISSTVSTPTAAIPTAAIPTAAIPTAAIPTVASPTVASPTASEPSVSEATAPVSETTAPAAVRSATPPSSVKGNLFAAISREMDRQRGAPAPVIPRTDVVPESANRSTLQYIGQTLISLSLVILLILIFAWLTKRYLIRSTVLGGGYIHLLGSYSLSPKSKIHLVRVGRDRYLIGEGASSVSLLSKIQETEPPEEPEEEELLSGPISEEDPRPLTPFGDRLEEWQNALETQAIRPQVNASLLLLGGLAKRLRRKGGQSDG